MKMKRRSYRFVTLIMAGVLVVLTAKATLAQEDPGVQGPRATSMEVYNFGDTVFRPSSPAWPLTYPALEVTGVVHYPMDLSGGPFPVVFFLHGFHATCFLGGSVFLQWPCAPPRQPLPNYRGYDYLGDVLASHGYIAISISANGINARDNSLFDVGMAARAELLQHHMDRWNTFNTVGGAPFGTRFIGRLNMGNIGTVGHSRGGEGVATNYAYNASLGYPYGINAVLTIEPVNFFRRAINNAALAVLLGYCDGDVADLQGVHYYDDVRYNMPGDYGPKHTILVMGANHAYYNTVWSPPTVGSYDDWIQFTPGGSSDPFCGPAFPGNGRLSLARQMGTGLAYIVGFFRLYLGIEDFFGYFSGDFPPPPSATTDEIYLSYHPPDDPSWRRDVNRLLTDINLSTSTQGGAVLQSGLTPYNLCGGEAPQDRHCLPSMPYRGGEARQPHTVVSARATTRRGLSQLRSGWDDTSAYYYTEVPAGVGDVLGYNALQVRAGINFADSRNPSGLPQDFTVLLTDGSGNIAATLVSYWSRALFYPPGTVIPVPKVLLNTVRIPLYAFKGVDLSNITGIYFVYDQTTSGALLMTDLAFVF